MMTNREEQSPIYPWLPPRCTRLIFLLLGLAVTVALTVLMFHNQLKMQFFLLWNMFLAALPLLFALLIFRYRSRRRHPLPVTLLGLLWLFFYPNAPYMLTDLIHLSRFSYRLEDGGFAPRPLVWLALLVIVTAVLVGCLCGALSVYLLHMQVWGRWGGAAGWIFVAASSSLGGVGIYLGRFLRFNTWDLVSDPVSIIASVVSDFGLKTVSLYVIFTALTLLPYLLFYFCFHQENPQDERN